MMWLRIVIARFLWPALSGGVHAMVSQKLDHSMNEFQQEQRAFMLENREHMRIVGRDNISDREANERRHQEFMEALKFIANCCVRHS